MQKYRRRTDDFRIPNKVPESNKRKQLSMPKLLLQNQQSFLLFNKND